MKINGKKISLEENTTLDVILTGQGFDIKKIAVMKNGDIIPKAEYGNTIILPEDSIEVVSFVGGG